MAERKHRLEEGNRIIREQQDETIERNQEALELLASEKVVKKVEGREKILDNLNEALLEIEKELWKDPEFLKAMEGLED